MATLMLLNLPLIPLINMNCSQLASVFAFLSSVRNIRDQLIASRNCNPCVCSESINPHLLLTLNDQAILFFSQRMKLSTVISKKYTSSAAKFFNYHFISTASFYKLIILNNRLGRCR